MNLRCSCPDRKDSKWYYDKGIKVCESWKTFANFKRDMEPSWEEGLWLDRINSDEDYTPENCRWITPSKQQINRKVQETNPSQHKGIFLRKENGRYRTGVMINGKWKWLGTFIHLNDAITKRQEAEKEYYVS
jgi:hypothetical protein